MRDRRRTIIGALAGGVVLASAAFAAGSQVGDGSATAKGGGDRAAVEPAVLPAPPGAGDVTFVHRRGEPGARFAPFGDLAERLGVSERRLHDALDDLRPQGDPHERITAAVAEELGVSADRVRDAFEKAHDELHADFARRLADRLGIDREKVEEALPRPPGP